MTEQFSVKGSFSVLVDGEIEKPNDWDKLSETGKRRNIARQLTNEIYDEDDHFTGFDPSASIVTEVLESAEEIFNE